MQGALAQNEGCEKVQEKSKENVGDGSIAISLILCAQEQAMTIHYAHPPGLMTRRMGAKCSLLMCRGSSTRRSAAPHAVRPPLLPETPEADPGGVRSCCPGLESRPFCPGLPDEVLLSKGGADSSVQCPGPRSFRPGLRAQVIVSSGKNPGLSAWRGAQLSQSRGLDLASSVQAP